LGEDFLPHLNRCESNKKYFEGKGRSSYQRKFAMITPELIVGIVISEFDEKYGPKVEIEYPIKWTDEQKKHISYKSFSLFMDERVIPKKLGFVELSSVGKKAMVRGLEWEDDTRRGGKGIAVITIMYEEKDDLVFYKYQQDLAVPMGDFAEKYKYYRRSKHDEQWITQALADLQSQILTMLEKFAADEELPAEEEFPAEEVPASLPSEKLYSTKAIIVGDPNVGKSSMILQYTKRAFKRSYLPTIGANITEKKIKKKNATLQFIFWDIAGQAKFSSVRRQFYQGANIVLLVFDLTNLESLNSITKWREDVQKTVGDNPQIQWILCGNKSDLKEEIQIRPDQALQLANQLGFPYFQVSAFSGENITTVFNFLADNLLK
jgi:small GTP-binding protein